ncbi:exonuclease subunit SbcD [Neisseriaceae bacterium PsAf]|nr:exonuclease subunit SbcD [Neisseriaceae bacterium PsAf]
MKILHTSDWHLGRSLYGQKRYAEHEAFLNWLIDLIEKEHIEILLVSGDIFDTNTPSNQAQRLYYQFSRHLPRYCQAVIIAGNHDSATFLNASKELLECLNIFVVGQISNNIQDEIFLLQDAQQNPQAIICTVPYLRDKDIRTLESGESVQDKNQQLLKGIKQHYQQVSEYALKLQQRIQKEKTITIPIIAMGHLFTAGAKTVEGDGVRDLYVGSLNHVTADIFPDHLDYVALGHLHTPQVVAGKTHIRYSGSPIPIGFGECSQTKQVILLEFSSTSFEINSIEVPVFQKLIRIQGDLTKIIQDIQLLKKTSSKAWLEIEYTGEEREPRLREKIEEVIFGSELKVLKIKNNLIYNRVMNTLEQQENLQDLTPIDVFKRCLTASEIPENQHNLLISAYNDIIQNLPDLDINAE